MWESISGILMNHPEIISNISLPQWLVPSQYHLSNWNRSSLIKMIYSNKNDQRAFVCGKQGIWETKDNGITFQSYMKGYPESPFYFKTNDIYLHETDSIDLLFAGSNIGLFVSNINEGLWKKIDLGDEDEAIKRILKIRNNLVVFSESNIYQTKISNPLFGYKKVTPEIDELKSEVSLIDLFFHLHDGRIWGLPGKLLFDLVGIIIFFLSISAFYIWYYPKMMTFRTNKKLPLKQNAKRVHKFLFKYHLKLGIWTAVITIIIAGTGFFMRPPLLIAIAKGSIDAEYYPGFLSDNPLHEKIQNALYDSVENEIIIATSDGIYSGPAGFEQPFRKDSLNTPIFVMGATVLDNYDLDGYLIGSFSGLFYLDKNTGKSVNKLTGKVEEKVSNIRPAEKMITGYFKTPNGEEFITAHSQGLLPLNKAEINNRFKMPLELTANFAMPLWNYLFEIHNGRFFKGLVGGFYILIVPLGALFFLVITITGIYDWFYIRPPKG